MSTTQRVYKTNKVIKLTFSGLAADALLTDADGNSYFDVSDVNWQRIVIEHNVTTLTGTNVIFKAITTNDVSNSGATTDAAVTQADGSTAFVSATVTAAGRGAKSFGKTASAGASASNLGKYLGIWADVTSVTVLTGEVYIYVEGQ